jgi:hypothetical protein
MTALKLGLAWLVALEPVEVLEALDVLELLHAAAKRHVSAVAAPAAASVRDLFGRPIPSPERIKTEVPVSAGLHSRLSVIKGPIGCLPPGNDVYHAYGSHRCQE